MLTPIYGANKPEAPQRLQKTGVIVNLDEQTVFFMGYLIPIESVDGASINFGGRPTQQSSPTLTLLQSTMRWFASDSEGQSLIARADEVIEQLSRCPLLGVKRT
jgi:hypothetical protein